MIVPRREILETIIYQILGILAQHFWCFRINVLVILQVGGFCLHWAGVCRVFAWQNYPQLRRRKVNTKYLECYVDEISIQNTKACPLRITPIQSKGVKRKAKAFSQPPRSIILLKIWRETHDFPSLPDNIPSFQQVIRH